MDTYIYYYNTNKKKPHKRKKGSLLRLIPLNERKFDFQAIVLFSYSIINNNR